MSTGRHCYSDNVAESTDTDTTIGENIRRFREALGLSQAQLAQRLVDGGLEGFYPQTVLRVEKGIRPLRLAEALVVAEALNTELGALAADSERSEMLRVIADMTSKRNELLRAGREYVRVRVEAEALLDRLEAGVVAAEGVRSSDEIDEVRGNIFEIREGLPEHPADLLATHLRIRHGRLYDVTTPADVPKIALPVTWDS